MADLVEILPRRDLLAADIRAMHRLRARVFKDRLKWDVEILSGMEIDGYDALEPHYMVIRSSDRTLLGCWRLLPTEGPYMLKDTFPQLLHGQRVPEDRHTWELSRFAIDTDGPRGFGFAALAIEAMRRAVEFADRHGICAYVTVTTTPIERLLCRTGIQMRRFGPPLRIGVADSVALHIDLGARTHEALFGRVAQAA